MTLVATHKPEETEVYDDDAPIRIWLLFQ